MVTFITDKLQKQTLSDAQFEPISYETHPPRPGGVWNQTTQPSPADAPCHALGELEPFKEAERRRNISDKFRSKSTDPALYRSSQNDNNGMGDNRSMSLGSMLPPLTLYGRDMTGVIPSALCVHNKNLLLCQLCGDLTPGTPPNDPPKKRLCRSKSIPGDSTCGNKWQPKASSIWKPVNHRTHSNLKHSHKSRHSPLVVHKPKARRASPACNSMYYHHSNNSGFHSNQGSGGNRFSPGGILKNFNSADNVATPSESPVPRPASASSGFYDSSASQTSLNTSWTEGFSHNIVNYNCFSPQPQQLRSAFSKNRSLSHEGDNASSNIAHAWPYNINLTTQQMSLGASSMPMIFTGAESPGGFGVERPSSAGFGSVTGSGNGVSSVPSSPRRTRVPRCRSQPCVLPERKHGGLKRRRDGRHDNRPSIDFAKMTESFKSRSNSTTASVHCARPKSVTFAQEIQEIGNTREPDDTYSNTSPETGSAGFYPLLDTIASSPYDSHLAHSSLKPQPNFSASGSTKSRTNDSEMRGFIQTTVVSLPPVNLSTPVTTDVSSNNSPFKVPTDMPRKSSSFKAHLDFEMKSSSSQQYYTAKDDGSWKSMTNNSLQQNTIQNHTTVQQQTFLNANFPVMNYSANNQPDTSFNFRNDSNNASFTSRTENNKPSLNQTELYEAQRMNNTSEKAKNINTPEIQWDSGCSDTNDPPDLISFEESENSCSYDDHSVLIDDDASSQQFEIEMSNDLDLEQIEKDMID